MLKRADRKYPEDMQKNPKTIQKTSRKHPENIQKRSRKYPKESIKTEEILYVSVFSPKRSKPLESNLFARCFILR